MRRLHRQADAARWHVSAERFGDALQRSAARAVAGRDLTTAEIDRHLSSLHLADLALACACEDGHDPAWEHFVREMRPALYRAADALDPSGGARELADAIYADLFGVKTAGAERHSLFRYFHGRSTLATWLRAVLAQRHVDRLRAGSRHDPLPDDDAPAAMAAAPARIDPDRARLLGAVRGALAAALDALAPRDRLRLSAYYAQELTLAQTGRLTGEHEATVSRQLAKTRTALRTAVETRLAAAGFSSAQIAQGLADILDDAGPLDLRVLLPDEAERKKSGQDRSEGRTAP